MDTGKCETISATDVEFGKMYLIGTAHIWAVGELFALGRASGSLRKSNFADTPRIWRLGRNLLFPQGVYFGYQRLAGRPEHLIAGDSSSRAIV